MRLQKKKILWMAAMSSPGILAMCTSPSDQNGTDQDAGLGMTGNTKVDSETDDDFDSKLDTGMDTNANSDTNGTCEYACQDRCSPPGGTEMSGSCPPGQKCCDVEDTTDDGNTDTDVDGDTDIGSDTDTGGDTNISSIPDPTREVLEDEGGPLEVASTTISNPEGWAGGTVVYPTAEGSYPTVTIIAGLNGVMQTMEWVANALAPWGFVAVATECSPTSSMSTEDRGVQMSAAFDQLLALNEDSNSPLFGKLNGRFGVAGHSLGGGGTFHALINDSRVETGMPMAPANIDNLNLSAITKPTFLIACSTDDLCTPASIEEFYRSINQTEKLYVNMDSSSASSMGHLCVETTAGESLRPLQNLLARAWFSYWIRDDDRFGRFLCGDESQADNSAVVGWQDTCAF